MKHTIFSIMIAASLLTFGSLGAAASQPKSLTRTSGILRVTADPNNLPFSNERGEGFENKIAQVLAEELGLKVEYTWRAQRRGFFRSAFQDDQSDVVMGVPAGSEHALVTKPYYRSSYVFVTRKDQGLDIRNFDDPSLRALHIGIQLVGDDGVNTPPAHALARRGIVNNVVGYTLYGDYRTETPPASIIDALGNGDIDVAVVWGPLAGYFAPRQAADLVFAPVSPDVDPPGLSFAFDIGLGVRKSNTALRDALDRALLEHQGTIRRVLDEYGVPQASPGTNAAMTGASGD